MSVTTQTQHVYALTRRDFGEHYAAEGDLSIVSMHGTVQSANNAARALALGERPCGYDLDDIDYQEDYCDDNTVSISWRYDDYGWPGIEIEVREWKLQDDGPDIIIPRPSCELNGNQPQHVYALTRRDFGEFNANEGDLSIVSMHATVEAANDAAKTIADAEVNDQDELNFEENYDEDGAVSFSWRYDDDYGEPGAEVQVKKWDLQGHESEVIVSRPDRQLVGGVIPFQQGRPLLRGAKFKILGELQSMSKEVVEQAIKTYNGKVVDWLSEADYVVVGTVPGAPDLSWTDRFGAEQIDEATLLAFIELGIPPQKVLRRDSVQEVPSTTSTAVARPPLAEISLQLPRPAHDVQALARLGGAGQENCCGPPAKRPRM